MPLAFPDDPGVHKDRWGNPCIPVAHLGHGMFYVESLETPVPIVTGYDENGQTEIEPLKNPQPIPDPYQLEE